MADHSDLDPAALKPGAVSGSNLKAGLTTSAYSGGVPSSAAEIKAALLAVEGGLKAGLLLLELLKPGIVGDQPTAPANVVAPSISGTPEVGQTLNGNRGSWSGNPSPSFDYEWLADDVPILGADGLTYTLQAGDEGALIKFRVSATNSEGGPITATSSAVGPVDPFAPSGGFFGDFFDAFFDTFFEAV